MWPIGVLVSPRRDAAAARGFFRQAIAATRTRPVEVVTDRAATYPIVLDELLPAAWHRTERYANNRIEADHPVGVMVTEEHVGLTTEPTLRDLSEALIAVYGTDYGIHSPTWMQLGLADALITWFGPPTAA